MERLTKRDTDGQAMMDCEKCKADWTGKHGKPMVDCTALYCRNCLKDRIAAYEDTGLTPGDIKELLDMAVSKTDKVLRLKEELHAMKNELCQYCGKYKNAHEGACDGCKWREM